MFKTIHTDIPGSHLQEIIETFSEREFQNHVNALKYKRLTPHRCGSIAEFE